MRVHVYRIPCAIWTFFIFGPQKPYKDMFLTILAWTALPSGGQVLKTSVIVLSLKAMWLLKSSKAVCFAPVLKNEVTLSWDFRVGQMHEQKHTQSQDFCCTLFPGTWLIPHVRKCSEIPFWCSCAVLSLIVSSVSYVQWHSEVDQKWQQEKVPDFEGKTIP